MGRSSCILLAVIGAVLLGACAPAPRQQSPEHTCTAARRAENEAIVRIVFDEILSRGRIAENEWVYHSDFVLHGLTRDAGRAEDRAAADGWRQAMPDLQVRVLRAVSDCDLVAVHWEASGTNTGEGMGLPATGRAMRVRGVSFFAIRDGRIAEEWTEFDQSAILRQLGLPGE